MELGDVYKVYDLVRERAARVKKATGLDWEIGGGSQVNIWVTLNDGSILSEQAQDGICASLVKVFDKAAPNGLTAVLAKQGTWDKAKIGASNNQVWCDFPNRVMNQISMEDFVELCDVLMQRGSAEIQKGVGKSSESKFKCSMQKKKEALSKSDATKNDTRPESQKIVDALGLKDVEILTNKALDDKEGTVVDNKGRFLIFPTEKEFVGCIYPNEDVTSNRDYDVIFKYTDYKDLKNILNVWLRAKPFNWNG